MLLAAAASADPPPNAIEDVPEELIMKELTRRKKLMPFSKIMRFFFFVFDFFEYLNK